MQAQSRLQFKPADEGHSGDAPFATEAGSVEVEPGPSGPLNAGSRVGSTTQPGASIFTL